jgi:hypothetical protein
MFWFRDVNLNIKAGLQSGIPLCCILNYSFIMSPSLCNRNGTYKNPKRSIMYKANRYFIYLSNKIRYHKQASYIQCPLCIILNRKRKILVDCLEHEDQNCHDTTWNKAIEHFLNKKQYIHKQKAKRRSLFWKLWKRQKVKK